MLTIKDALSLATETLSNSDSPALDSEVLLAYTLKKDRSYFRAWPEKTLSSEESNTFSYLISQRKVGTPIAYLVNEREFWSRSFLVSPNVLIPRPETELLIEIIQNKFTANEKLSILDLGTGSGAIAITLALEFNASTVYAIDSSQDALEVAKKNAQKHLANNVQFILSNWFDNSPRIRFDLIVSNPPYIRHDDPHLTEGDVRFEPKSALVADNNGLKDIKHITQNAEKFLKPNGFLLFEHGYEQGNQVQNLLESSGFEAIEQFRDIQGHHRATLGYHS